MLSDIKKKSSGIAGSLVIIIIAIMVCLGSIQYYLNASSKEKIVARVGKLDITNSTLSAAYNQGKYIYQQNGVDLTNDALRVLKSQSLDQLIQQALRSLFIESTQFILPNSLRDKYVTSQPYFQVDGHFSPELYQQKVLQAFGSEAMYLQHLSSELSVKMLNKSIEDSAFLLSSELAKITGILNMQRDVSVLELQPSMITVPAISDSAAKTYYQEHQATFTSDESVRVAYVILDKESIKQKLQSNPELLSNFYQSQQHIYTKPPQYQYTLYRIEDSVNKLSNVSDSERVLRKHLSDAGLEAYFTDHPNVSIKVTQKKAWHATSKIPALLMESLKQLSTDRVVLLSDGKTIVELHDVKPASVPPLSAISTRVESDWKNNEAEQQYARLLDQLAELAYTTDSIDELAKQLHLTVHDTERFTRHNPPAQFAKVSSFTAQAFSEPVLEDHMHSSIVKIDDNKALVLHLIQHYPASQKSFAQVKESIISKLTRDNRSQALKPASNTLLEGYMQQGNPSFKAFSIKPVWKSLANIRRDGIINRFAMEIRDAVFEMPLPTKKQPSYVSYTRENGNIVLIHLLKQHDPESSTVSLDQVYTDYSNLMKMAALEQFDNQLAKEHPIKKFDLAS